VSIQPAIQAVFRRQIYQISKFENQAAGINSNCKNLIHSKGYNLIGSMSGCSFVSAASDLATGASEYYPLRDNGGATMTHALTETSSAIDVVHPWFCIDQNGKKISGDQRLVSRDSKCDIGAYELAPESVDDSRQPILGVPVHVDRCSPIKNSPDINLSSQDDLDASIAVCGPWADGMLENQGELLQQDGDFEMIDAAAPAIPQDEIYDPTFVEEEPRVGQGCGFISGYGESDWSLLLIGLFGLFLFLAHKPSKRLADVFLVSKIIILSLLMLALSI
jgi:hypothetical protein